jgi:N-carbamoyl-L-amino-acid hydrolase
MLSKSGDVWSEDLDDALYTLATFIKGVLPRRSFNRKSLEEIILLVLGQVEAYHNSSISNRRFNWVVRLLSGAESDGGLGLIDNELADDEVERIYEDVVEDLSKRRLVIASSGSMSLSDTGSKYVNDKLFPILNRLDHKRLDWITERIDFWLVAAFEFQKALEACLDQQPKLTTGESSLVTFLTRKHDLFESLKPKVRRVVKEYRQTIPPDEFSSLQRAEEKDPLDSVKRVERDINEIANFSRRIGSGVTRLAFSNDETQVMDWARDRLQLEFNYRCKFDDFLNFYAYDRREGNRRILVGTHVDTVVNGGKYDGAVGLVAFLEALRLAREEAKVFPLPVDFVIFRAEESSVFKKALLGSKVATGTLGVDDFRSMHFSRDQDLMQNLARYYPEFTEFEFMPNNLFDILSKRNDSFADKIRNGCWLLDYPKEAYVAYIETHIEQGPVLEVNGKNLGIVTSFRAPIREIITIIGKWNHSGTTPMGLMYRQDAGCAMAACVLACERIGNEESANGVDVVVTNGEQGVPGGGINKVPGKAVFTLDVRSHDSDEQKRVLSRIHTEITEICGRRRVSFQYEQTENSKPVSLIDDADSLVLQDRLENVISKLGYSYIKLPSGAGHDAMSVFRAGIPTSMVFIPCKDGISHSPDEKAETTDIVRVSKVLLGFLCDFLNFPSPNCNSSALSSQFSNKGEN